MEINPNLELHSSPSIEFLITDIIEHKYSANRILAYFDFRMVKFVDQYTP